MAEAFPFQCAFKRPPHGRNAGNLMQTSRPEPGRPQLPRPSSWLRKEEACVELKSTLDGLGIISGPAPEVSTPWHR